MKETLMEAPELTPGADSTPFSPLLMAPPPPSTLGCLGSRSELLMGTVYWREKLPYSHHVATYMQSCLVFPKTTSSSPLRLNSPHVSGSHQSCTMTGFSWIFRTVALEMVRSQLRVCCKDPGWYKGLWLCRRLALASMEQVWFLSVMVGKFMLYVRWWPLHLEFDTMSLLFSNILTYRNTKIICLDTYHLVSDTGFSHF